LFNRGLTGWTIVQKGFNKIYLVRLEKSGLIYPKSSQEKHGLTKRYYVDEDRLLDFFNKLLYSKFKVLIQPQRLIFKVFLNDILFSTFSENPMNQKDYWEKDPLDTSIIAIKKWVAYTNKVLIEVYNYSSDLYSELRESDEFYKLWFLFRRFNIFRTGLGMDYSEVAKMLEGNNENKNEFLNEKELNKIIDVLIKGGIDKKFIPIILTSLFPLGIEDILYPEKIEDANFIPKFRKELNKLQVNVSKAKNLYAKQWVVDREAREQIKYWIKQVKYFEKEKMKLKKLQKSLKTEDYEEAFKTFNELEKSEVLERTE
jgi:hypothetical protein